MTMNTNDRGVVNLFGLFEPLGGWRHMNVTDRRTKADLAHQMPALVDIHCPDAESIRLVVDNLNIHHRATRYETFPPDEANGILKKLEFHFTPKHASWLNQVEIEFSLMSRQCLNRRIGTKQELTDEINTRQQHRNQQKATVNWRFKTTDARTKLGRLYPRVS